MMPSWNAEQYLKFADERTRPCRDLAAAIALPQVRRLVDLGCGPGNSTTVLAERWPDAAITGFDSSVEMLDYARGAYPNLNWVQGDISEWVESDAEPYDLVFSNTALQWIGDHEN